MKDLNINQETRLSPGYDNNMTVKSLPQGGKQIPKDTPLNDSYMFELHMINLQKQHVA